MTNDIVSLDVTTVSHPDVSIVTVAGEIDLCTSPRLEIELTTTDPDLPLIADLGSVTFCSAGGLGLLEAANDHHARRSDPLSRGGVAVLTRQPAVLRPLRLLGLERKLTVVATMGQARAWLGLPPRPALAAGLR